jgi:3',5'-cyclic AMP phosphodiesterase CpdA
MATEGPLWDLTRGDADDNRSSPHGLGWRALAISTALEFNYLTAATSFIWLILVSAILVGLTVPGVMALAHWKLKALELITLRPAAALSALALLVGVALWIAKPLIAMSLDNFWHLHYTLVFPVFVTLREAISAGLEWLPPRTLNPEQLHRRRRISAILTTILLAGGGLTLASRVQFVTFIGVQELRPIALTSAALSNALVVLGLSTIVASLYWFGREISSGHPVFNWTPVPPTPGRRTMRIAHLSDPHFVGEPYGYRMEAGTEGPCGNAQLVQAFRELDAIHAAHPLNRILVTGDITDAVTRAEWLEFLALVRQWPALRRRLLFLPGNHDVNIIDRTNPGRQDVPWSVTGALRKLRVILALDAVQGESVRVVGRRSGTLGPTLQEYLRTGNRPNLLRDLAERGTWRARREVLKVWEEIFPLVAPPSDESCGVVLLDSNAHRYFSLTNAIGIIGPDQLRALDSVLQASPGAAWIIALHHHLVEYPIRGLGLDERVGVVLVNSADVLRVIARHDPPVLVLHGHRHRDWIGTSGDTVLCSAPSVTLGDKGSHSTCGSFSLYDVAFASDERIQLISVERVAVISG